MTVFYSIGGGSVISPPPSRSNMSRLGLNDGWSSDLMCGNFDLKTTVGNQLNGITSGFKDLMGNVIQGATGAVMSMPAMAIQRANPGLYEMLTNGVLQAGLSYDKALLNCQNMSKNSPITLWAASGSRLLYLRSTRISWRPAAGMRSPATSNCRRPPVKKVSPGSAARSAVVRAAGHPAHPDLAKAGYNMMNSLPVTSNSSVGSASCNGTACQRWPSSDDAAAAVVKVLGDRSIRTCRETSECTSGGTDNQPGSTVAGTGFSPVLEDATKTNLEQLDKLVGGQIQPTAENLGALKTGSLVVTRGVIQSLRDDPDKAALVQRLAGELAMADTVETALTMRRMLTTGESEPNAAEQPEAIAEGDRRIDALDRELNALRNEMELRKAISNNSLLTTLERQGARNQDNQLQQKAGNQDQGFSQMNQTQSSGAK
jgi:hypothetical protein